MDSCDSVELVMGVTYGNQQSTVSIVAPLNLRFKVELLVRFKVENQNTTDSTESRISQVR